MPALRNQRHERFASAVAEGKTLAEAHAIAGYRPHRANPTRLRGCGEIDERIREIIAQRRRIEEQAVERAIEDRRITRASVLQMLLEDRELARAKGQVGAAIKADELIGKELGMFIDRHQHEHSLEHRLANMTEEQKREDIEETIRKIKRLVGREPATPEPLMIDVEPTKLIG